MSSTPKFSTTREVRNLSGLLRQFMLTSNEFEDVGKTTGEQAREFITRFVATEGNYHVLKAQWGKATEATREQLISEWEFLRGKTEEARAEEYTLRHNQRVAKSAPLFAAMGALEEVETLTTPERVIQNWKNDHIRLQEILVKGREIDAKRAEKKALNINEATTGSLSINQCRVWAQLFRIHGETPNLAGAWEMLRATGDAGLQREIMTAIVRHFMANPRRERKTEFVQQLYRQSYRALCAAQLIERGL